MTPWQERAACLGRSEWTDLAPRQQHHDLIAACEVCPVLQPCRDWAARHRWAEVVIAGWRAPANVARPPWAAGR